MGYRKGVYRGSSNSHSRLTELQVQVIKQQLATGVTGASLARLYQVSGETIRRIGRGETWGWLDAKQGDGGINQPPLAEQGLPASRTISDEEIAASKERLRLLMEGRKP